MLRSQPSMSTFGLSVMTRYLRESSLV
jgi:hypothetical protein